MTIRRALFLGGAVLVLAACSDAISPAAASRHGGAIASVKKEPQPTSTNTSTVESTGCRSGYVVGSGRDSTETSSDSTCVTSY